MAQMPPIQERIEVIRALRKATPEKHPPEYLPCPPFTQWFGPIVYGRTLPERIVAATRWWGFVVLFNNWYLSKKYLETHLKYTLPHELIHCTLFFNKVGVDKKTPYYLRYHEAMAYHLPKDCFDPCFLCIADRDYPTGFGEPREVISKAIFYDTLAEKLVGRGTPDARNRATQKLIGKTWFALRDECVLKVEKEIGKKYPRWTTYRLEDLERAMERLEREKAEGKKAKGSGQKERE